MGCLVTQPVQPSQDRLCTQQDIQRQIDLQYSKKIFSFIIDTLFILAHKFQPQNYGLYKQLHSGIDCSTKNLSQLTFQLKLNIILFQISKRKIEIDQKQEDLLIETKVRQKIENYQLFFSNKDKEISELCIKLIQILNGNYSNQVQTIQTFSIQPKSQLKPSVFVRQGIKATLMKEEVQNNFNAFIKLKQAGLEKTTFGQKIIA